MTSQKIRKYFTFNMGKSYTFVDVQVTDEGAETMHSLNARFRCIMILFMRGSN